MKTWIILHVIDVANVVALGMLAGFIVGGYYVYRERKELFGPKV